MGHGRRLLRPDGLHLHRHRQQGGQRLHQGPPRPERRSSPRPTRGTRCVILSPQPPARVKSEVETKAGRAARATVVVPARTRGAGPDDLSGTVALKDLGAGDPAKWGYQVVMQSNEGFPDKADLLTRKVNEFEGQHRFGGGNDGDCDPHAMDVLAGKGDGRQERDRRAEEDARLRVQRRRDVEEDGDADDGPQVGAGTDPSSFG